MNKRTLKQYELLLPAYIHEVTYRFLGWGEETRYNRWHYPDILLWDEDEAGHNIVPGLIALYFDPTKRYNYEARNALTWQLRDRLAGKYTVYWMMEEGFVLAEREGEGIESVIPYEVKRQHHFGIMAYDQALSENGHREGGIGESDVFVVP